jgi:hypothetical protein
MGVSQVLKLLTEIKSQQPIHPERVDPSQNHSIVVTDSTNLADISGLIAPKVRSTNPITLIIGKIIHNELPRIAVPNPL